MARITKSQFFQNKTVCANASEILSCMKVCHGKDIDSEVILNYAWRFDRDWFSDRARSMQEISNYCKALNKDFYQYFKIKLRR
jgi:hypothetical protein